MAPVWWPYGFPRTGIEPWRHRYGPYHTPSLIRAGRAREPTAVRQRRDDPGGRAPPSSRGCWKRSGTNAASMPATIGCTIGTIGAGRRRARNHDMDTAGRLDTVPRKDREPVQLRLLVLLRLPGAGHGLALSAEAHAPGGGDRRP